MNQMPRVPSIDTVRKMFSNAILYKNQALFVAILLVAGLMAKNIVGSWGREKLAMGKQQEAIAMQYEMKRQLAAVEKDLGGLTDQMLDSDFFLLKGIIEKMAKESGLKVVSLKPGNETALPAYKRMEVVMITKGEYQNVIRFMGVLEEVTLPIEIASLNIVLESGPRKDDRGLNIDLKVVAMARDR